MNTNDKRVLLRRGCEARQLSGGLPPGGLFMSNYITFIFKLPDVQLHPSAIGLGGSNRIINQLNK